MQELLIGEVLNLGHLGIIIRTPAVDKERVRRRGIDRLAPRLTMILSLVLSISYILVFFRPSLPFPNLFESCFFLPVGVFGNAEYFADGVVEPFRIGVARNVGRGSRLHLSSHIRCDLIAGSIFIAEQHEPYTGISVSAIIYLVPGKTMEPLYIPILKGKPGEFAALQFLRFSTRARIIPLIEITPPPTRRKASVSTKPTTIERRMKEQANAIMKAWKVLGLPLFIDTQHLGVSAPAGLATIFRHLNPTGDEDNDDRLRALPVTGPERNAEYKATVCDIISARKNGACYRIPPTFLNHSLGTHLSEFLRTTKLSPHYIHLIFDLGYLPNQSAEIEPLVMLICGCLAILPDLANWRTIAVAGSSFPENLSDLKSRINSIPRAEWQLWSSLSKLETLPRTPMFADYAIQHPTLPPSGFKGTANIRYTTEASWLVFKGSVLDERDKATSGVVQFKALARDVAQHPAFCKHDFSPGDEYIDDCANWETPSGQPTKWREVGTSHHITYVVYQLATDPDSLAQS